MKKVLSTLILLGVVLMFGISLNSCSEDNVTTNTNNTNTTDSTKGETLDCSNGGAVYLHTNGVTVIACPNAQVGDTGYIDGKMYIVADNRMLDNASYGKNVDWTKYCTSRVTKFEGINFDNADVSEPFNQPIGHWDVSNFTDLYGLFNGCEEFNQPLEHWDVSNVTDMSLFFNLTKTLVVGM
jgi:surface protein